MSVALAALLVAQAATPEAVLLDAFKGACQRIDDFEAAKADAAAAGWTVAEESAEPRIARLLTMGREAVGDEGRISGALFSRHIGGRNVFLVLSRYEEDGFWGNGCRAFDFDAPAALEPKTVDGWMGKVPTAADTAAGVAKRVWEPGWRDGVTVEANYVTPGTPIAEATGLQGVVLVAQSMGGL